MKKSKFTFLNIRDIWMEDSKEVLENLFGVSIDKIEATLPINWGDDAQSEDIKRYEALKNILSKKLTLELFFENFSNPSLVFKNHKNETALAAKFPKLIGWELERAQVNNERVDGTIKEVLELGVRFSVEMEIEDIDLDDIYSNSDEVIEQMQECSHMANWDIPGVVFTDDDPTWPEYEACLI